MAVAVGYFPGIANAGSNSRYASIVVDVDHNAVLHASQADAKRYPASLTKMMTLYLTFDALKHGRITWDQKLPVSAYAAGQPQTNISLKPGSKLSVRDAVYALIIRSANDASVVMAEALGKSVQNFGRMMTDKAHALGMNHTQFRNPNGLHDPNQYTTARDMAKLGIAIKRDFPEYYRLFKENKFTFNGRTYYSHNRVTLYTDGVDGIKTGYVNASGFNLVSSMHKNGRNLVGVVMGGRTAQSRDSHMVSLLSQALKEGGTGSNATYAFKTPPLPVNKPDRHSPQLAMLARQEPMAAPIEDSDVSSNPNATGVIREASALPQQIATEPLHQPSLFQPASYPGSNSMLTANVRPLSVPSVKDGASAESANWGIQVGAFSKARDALMAAAAAIEIAPSILSTSKIKVADAGTAESIHRARLANLTESQARNACRILKSHNESCFIYKANDTSEF
ncbi:MAG: D-alanyl-D-alanine carboxypeptidase [Alphaproteobacteria bacterium]|nr:D-alanyl-D-alanine carboxypeptidase [Alphaproteobacteria bacterium]